MADTQESFPLGNYEPGNCAWQTQREQTETAIYKRAAMEMTA